MSEEKKDNNQIAQSVSGFLDKYSDKLWTGVKHIYKTAADEVRRDWRIGYDTYLNNALRKYSTAKPFLSANRPTPLEEFYVPLGVTCDKTVIDKTSIKDLTETNKFAVIMASAGSGKSMLMQHLFVDTINQTRLVPVFVELRDLNNTDLTLFDLIKKKLRDNGFDFSDEYINVAIKAGHFAFFFDGFDEVAYVKREKIIKEIQDLSKYDQNYFVISSRFDYSLNYLKLFDVWKIQSLTLESACRLIEKRPESEEIKDKFIKALKEELFERHESFLSNPLLLSVMLITYKDRASIPEKLSIFYDNAYIALYDRHDAQKSFNRNPLSNLDIQQFRKVFAAFCFSSFNKRQFSFSDTEIYDYFETVQKLTSISFDKKAFLEDLIQGVCLLVRDGLKITFAHRSFQEYFTAVYISQLNKPQKQAQFIKKYFKVKYIDEGLSTDLTFDLIYEINPEIVERLYLIPQLEILENEIGYQGNFNIPIYLEYIKLVIENFVFIDSPKPDLSWYISPTQKYYFINFGIYVLQILGKSSDFNLLTFLDPKIDNIACKAISFFKKINRKPNHTKKNNEYSENTYRISSSALAEYPELIIILNSSNNPYSQNAIKKLIEIKKLLVNKYEEQEAYLDVELED